MKNVTNDLIVIAILQCMGITHCYERGLRVEGGAQGRLL